MDKDKIKTLKYIGTIIYKNFRGISFKDILDNFEDPECHVCKETNKVMKIYYDYNNCLAMCEDCYNEFNNWEDKKKGVYQWERENEKNK